jgi:hypothetical protein
VTLRRGPPSHITTEDLRITVRVLRQNGVSVEAISRLLRLDLATLDKHYGEELVTGTEEVEAQLGELVLHEALGGNVAMALGWLARFGSGKWRLPAAAPPAAEAPTYGMTDEQLQRQIAALDRITAEDPPTRETH